MFNKPHFSILKIVFVSGHVIAADARKFSLLLHLLQLLTVIVLSWLVFVIAGVIVTIVAILRVASCLIQRVTCSSEVGTISAGAVDR